jgi:hypothetical protein
MDKAGLRCPLPREVWDAVPVAHRVGGALNPASLSELLARVRERHPGATAEDVLAEAEMVGFEVVDDRWLAGGGHPPGW